MSFAFTAVRPETQGQDTDMTVPMGDYLSASFEAGWGGTLGKIHDFGKYLAEAGDDTSPMLTPEQLNKDYPVAEKWTAPARESVGMLLASKHEEEVRRSFYLQNDNHSFVAGAMGMGTSMVASILNPVDLALMFVPVVGPGARLGPVTETEMAAGALGRVGRFREALNTGILTTRGELAYATRFPYLAENVIQNTGFAVTVEGVNQIVAAHYKQDAGNPLLNVGSNIALGATIHGALNILGKVWHSLPSSLKEEMMVKAMDDFVKGKDIQVDEHLRTAEVFAKYQVAAHEDWITGLMSHEDAPLKQEPLNIDAFQKKIQSIYAEALGKLKAELLPRGKKPVVPGTETVPEQVAFSSVLDEIRQKNARTKEQIQKIYPQLSREEAAVLRRQAWNEQEVKTQHEQNLNDLFEKAKERNANKQMGAKRLARIAAEQNMPNPIPEAQLVEAVHEVVVPADSTIAKVEEGAKKAEKKVKAKEPKPKKEKPVTPIQEKAKAIGLTPMKGALGKKGYFTTTDPRFKGLSVIINEDGIHLNSIEAAEQGKGAGTEMLNKLKALADEMDKPITLTAEALEQTNKETLQKGFGELGTEQRGKAESLGTHGVETKKFGAGFTLLQGSVANQLEHVGDLIHRLSSHSGKPEHYPMFFGGGGEHFGVGAALNKIKNALFNFKEYVIPNGGLRLYVERVGKSNFEYLQGKGKEYAPKETPATEQEALKQMFDLLKAYADEHSKLKPLTKFQKLANDATIALGRLDDKGYVENLEKLQEALKDKNWEAHYYDTLTSSQAKLEAWYEKNGFTRVKGNEFIYEPKAKTESVTVSGFHGTPEAKGIETFKEGFTYFSNKEKLAGEYTSKRGIWTSKPTGVVVPADITFKNPLTIDAAGARNDNIPTPWHTWKQKVFGNLPKESFSVEAAAKKAKELGYDGLIVKNVVDTIDPTVKAKGDVYVSFDPKQIAKKIDSLEAKLKAEGEAKLKQLIEEAKPRPDIIQAATDCIIKNII